jgi:hypothetical protein
MHDHTTHHLKIPRVPLFSLSFTALLIASLLPSCWSPFDDLPPAPPMVAEPDCSTEGCDDDEICVARGGADQSDGADDAPEEWVCELDRDQDGVPYDDDCNDRDESVYPGADELCDDIDRDCDGEPFTTECDMVYGPTFQVTILLAESNSRWDDGVPFVSPASPPDLYVEFGKNLGSFNQWNCYTEEVPDENTAMWETSCSFTFEPGDAFKIAIRDKDAAGAELVEKWEWEGTEALYQLLSQLGEQELVDGADRLVYRLEIVD